MEKCIKAILLITKGHIGLPKTKTCSINISTERTRGRGNYKAVCKYVIAKFTTIDSRNRSVWICQVLSNKFIGNSECRPICSIKVKEPSTKWTHTLDNEKLG